MITRFAAILVFFVVTVTALGPQTTLTIGNGLVAPDGFTRVGSLVNGVTPGPVIRATKGDKFEVNVVNSLLNQNVSRGTSIHWHGIFQNHTNFMDGVSGVTQCPIAPGDSFLYTFQPDQVGTFWYHSHTGVQYCDGVRGALIIEDPNDPHRGLYDVDDDSTIITLADWAHGLADAFKGVVYADSVLINGKGRYPGGPQVDLAIINVEYGKRYRFRTIAMSCDVNFMLSIDNHDLQVIEADAAATEPYTVNTIQILPGQRYSFVLQANQAIGNYWVRALPDSGNLNLSTTFEGGVNSAILRYAGAPNVEPQTMQQTQQKLLAETELHPLSDPEAPGDPTPDGADVTFNLTASFDEATTRFLINNQSFVFPETPVLLQILRGARNAHDLLPAGGVLTVERNKVVQINFPTGVLGSPHALHLHGHDFSVVKSANASFNFKNPVRRDVVSAGDNVGDIVAIRFKTDNPGPWIFHCHIDFHFMAGFAIVFAEAPDQIPSANNGTSPAWNQLCPIWDTLPASAQGPQIDTNTTSTNTTSSTLSSRLFRACPDSSGRLPASSVPECPKLFNFWTTVGKNSNSTLKFLKRKLLQIMEK